MDKTDVMKAGALLREYMQNMSALNNLEKGGKVLSMDIASDLPAPREGVPPPSVRIMTQQLEFSPELLDDIKQALVDRRDQLAKELDDLGVTGLEAKRKKGK